MQEEIDLPLFFSEEKRKGIACIKLEKPNSCSKADKEK